MENSQKVIVPSYSQFGCIGTGASAIALGATLKRWYQMDDIRFFEKQGDSGGTWHVNSYPGCACDVPSALYSFSFASNAGWTKLMPSHHEIKKYHDGVADTYSLREKMIFYKQVDVCIWCEESSRWLMIIRDVRTGEIMHHECQILFAATGQLVEPRPCDIPGAASFQGDIFHTSRWNHDVSLEGKKVVVIGNGCTAAQLVPAIVDRTQSLTQIVRTKHWIVPTMNFIYPAIMQWIFRWIPFTLKLHRFQIFLGAESDFRLFPMTKAAAKLRENLRQRVEKYMRETAPAKYHDVLIPDFDIGCKRRIFDCGYLESLHKDKLHLTDSKIIEITPGGVQTADGHIDADVIVLATGFKTNMFVPFTDIRGRERTMDEHWKRFDGPEAYNCSVLSGFPNFFMLLGPNAATGHTSAIMAIENSVNYALRVLKPVLDGKAVAVDLKEDAEVEYANWVQETLQGRVWNAGCASWYINEKRWNAMAYPWTQGHYWYRSLFPVWSHWTQKTIQKPTSSIGGTKLALMVVFLAMLGGAFVCSQSPQLWSSIVFQAKACFRLVTTWAQKQH
ncbi:Flavoprotein [Penicillium malachiteum]|uniref:Flavoprotein n=1 Tax=Penicillium malachiteum TaxID=1324776 RepID=A0AAD6HHL9_9EURO|nr:Flavoprotein [Penicillium malachiteum]